MAQHDAVIDNSDGLTVRNDINNALAAVFTNHSGATSPATTFAYQWWADTTAGLLKMRNAADTAWIIKSTLATVIADFTSALETKLNNIETAADVTDAANVAAAGAVMDSDISAAEGILRKTGGGAYVGMKTNLGATTDPGAGNDTTQGYVIGSLWINVTLGKVWQAVDVSTGAAVWKELSAGSASLTLGTKQASTSGTAIDFTGIPAGVKRVMISFEGVSLSGADNILVQLGDAGGFETTGYVSTGWEAFPVVVSSTVGFSIQSGATAFIFSGVMILTRMDGSALWASKHSGKLSTLRVAFGGGNKTLSAELTQIRITRNGTNTFDAGSINIMYE